MVRSARLTDDGGLGEALLEGGDDAALGCTVSLCLQVSCTLRRKDN